MADILERLNEACIGHPHAKIPWPHYVLHDARREILRLTQELEAAEAKGREAGLEEAAALADKRKKAIREGVFPTYLKEAAEAGANCAGWIATAIRALKAPAIGSQGTEKGRG